MEFYELNRLYDQNLYSTFLSKTIDRYMFIAMPILISFGCGISFINIVALSRSGISMTSKHYLFSQLVFNFLFQLVSSIVFITNYYEKYLINHYFSNNKHIYLNLKLIINFIYNVNLYSLVWLFTIGVLDFCITTIIKYHLNSNFTKTYTNTFYRQQNLFNYQQKLLKRKIQCMHYKQNKLKQFNQQHYVSVNHQNANFNDIKERKCLNSMNSVSSTNSYIQDDVFAQVNQTSNFEESVSKNETINYEKQNSKFKESDISEVIFIDNNTNINNTEINKKSVKDTKNEDFEYETLFCQANTIQFSIITIIFLSFLLAFPQMFAYEIKQNKLSISPSQAPSPAQLQNLLNSNDNNNRIYENLHFISKDETFDPKNQDYLLNNKVTKKKKAPFNLAYSNNIAQAYAMSIKFNNDQKSKEILDTMRKTHSNFFTSDGFFELASQQYGYCNMIKNSLPLSKLNKNKQNLMSTTKLSPLSQIITSTVTLQQNEIEIVNLTIMCIKKNEVNNYLAYNTLYFWLEHTMIISVPISIILVVLVSLIYTFLKYNKLISKQKRIRQKRLKLSKLKYQNTLNYRYNCLFKQNFTNEDLGQKMQQNSQLNIDLQNIKVDYNQVQPKVIQVRQNLNGSNLNNFDIIATSVNEYYSSNDDYLLRDIDLEELDENEFKENIYERKICEKQLEDQNLNKLFILDSILYIILSFPYTLLRLVLDLFVKDQIKISLDFFILYKLALITFHLHLICKFFIILLFNDKFRSGLSKAFALQNSKCCRKSNKNMSDEQCFNDDSLNNINQQNHRNIKSHKIISKNTNVPCLCYIISICFCCCCCSDWILSKFKKVNSFYDLNSTYQNNYEWYGSCYDQDADDIKYHSIEFNSNYHQYLCPADPDLDNGNSNNNNNLNSDKTSNLNEFI